MVAERVLPQAVNPHRRYRGQGDCASATQFETGEAVLGGSDRGALTNRRA